MVCPEPSEQHRGRNLIIYLGKITMKWLNITQSVVNYHNPKREVTEF